MSKASCQRCGHSEHGSKHLPCLMCGNPIGSDCYRPAEQRQRAPIPRDLTFKTFQALNRKRCNEAFHKDGEWWPVQNWALAIAGEAGELCNLVKKVIRGDFSLEDKRQEILYEVADVMAYCDLLVTTLGGDTGEEVMRKFDIVSERIGWMPLPAQPTEEESR